MNPIVAWLHAIIMAAAPPERRARHDSFPGWDETAIQRAERYEAVASDLADVIYAPDTKPLFGGSLGRARSAVLVLAIAYHESGFAPDVDKGPCYRGKAGGSARCDHGKSACLMQIRIGDGTTQEGWTQKELFEDRKKCFSAGINLIRRSMAACRNLEERHRLNAYASGVCSKGHKGSEGLVNLMHQFMSSATIPREARSDGSSDRAEGKGNSNDAKPPKVPPKTTPPPGRIPRSRRR